ncbi:MAG TPA: AAA family ATPase [Polyangia bacterium]|nr:AAA family ATPase [Polyangia bacterium]
MLTRLCIDNYRCFLNFEFRPGPFTLVLGPNGTGKSSLLDALYCIHRLQSGWTHVGDLFPAESRYRGGAPERPQRFLLEATVSDIPFSYELLIEHDRRGRARLAREAMQREGRRLYEFDGTHAHLPMAGSPGDSDFPFQGHMSPLAALDLGRKSPLAPFLDWLRNLWVIRPVPQAMKAETSATTTWGLQPDLSNFAAWFQNLVQEEPRLAARITRSLRAVLPGFHGYTLARETEKTRTLRLLFRGGRRATEGSAGFALDELSDGQRMLVALYALLHEVLGTGGTLCLDEPENYLALPEIQPWLDEVRDQVVDRGGQVLLISHHPRVINLLATRYGYWFDRKGMGPVKARRIAIQEADEGLPVSELVSRGWIHE